MQAADEVQTRIHKENAQNQLSAASPSQQPIILTLQLSGYFISLEILLTYILSQLHPNDVESFIYCSQSSVNFFNSYNTLWDPFLDYAKFKTTLLKLKEQYTSHFIYRFFPLLRKPEYLSPLILKYRDILVASPLLLNMPHTQVMSAIKLLDATKIIDADGSFETPSDCTYLEQNSILKKTGFFYSPVFPGSGFDHFQNMYTISLKLESHEIADKSQIQGIFNKKIIKFILNSPLLKEPDFFKIVTILFTKQYVHDVIRFILTLHDLRNSMDAADFNLILRRTLSEIIQCSTLTKKQRILSLLTLNLRGLDFFTEYRITRPYEETDPIWHRSVIYRLSFSDDPNEIYDKKRILQHLRATLNHSDKSGIEQLYLLALKQFCVTDILNGETCFALFIKSFIVYLDNSLRTSDKTSPSTVNALSAETLQIISKTLSIIEKQGMANIHLFFYELIHLQHRLPKTVEALLFDVAESYGFTHTAKLLKMLNELSLDLTLLDFAPIFLAIIKNHGIAQLIFACKIMSDICCEPADTAKTSYKHLILETIIFTHILLKHKTLYLNDLIKTYVAFKNQAITTTKRPELIAPLLSAMLDCNVTNLNNLMRCYLQLHTIAQIFADEECDLSEIFLLLLTNAPENIILFITIIETFGKEMMDTSGCIPNNAYLPCVLLLHSCIKAAQIHGLNDIDKLNAELGYIVKLSREKFPELPEVILQYAMHIMTYGFNTPLRDSNAQANSATNARNSAHLLDITSITGAEQIAQIQFGLFRSTANIRASNNYHQSSSISQEEKDQLAKLISTWQEELNKEVQAIVFRSYREIHRADQKYPSLLKHPATVGEQTLKRLFEPTYFAGIMSKLSEFFSIQSAVLDKTYAQAMLSFLLRLRDYFNNTEMCSSLTKEQMIANAIKKTGMLFPPTQFDLTLDNLTASVRDLYVV